VFDLPGGAARLHTDAIGLHGVWVNGELVADAGGLRTDGRLAGELITAFRS
jgi:CelD/BcsL family acetyltransferase involved in cellulose biosynthesis